MMPERPSMKPSSYTAFYNIAISQNHVFRRINELVNFSFLTQKLAEKYCPNNGRMVIHPIPMFKYLFLKFMSPFPIFLIRFLINFYSFECNLTGLKLHSHSLKLKSLRYPCFRRIRGEFIIHT